jgi:AcrR family transcriptional regulator
VAAHDMETRRRLIEVAATLFAERGFNGVTVREICGAAAANVAAVNYHFRDKFGLYLEVVQAAIEAMRGTNAAALQAADGMPAEERLHAYVQRYLHILIGTQRTSWIHQLLAHEFHDPTPALDLVVEQVIRPRLAYLSDIVATMMACPPADERVRHAVASVQGQCLLYARNPVGVRLTPDWPTTPAAVDRLAEHITEFSIAGIRRMAAARR